MSRILITGSRGWTDAVTMLRVLRGAWHLFPEAVLVHGDAEGADRMAAGIWVSGARPVEAYPAGDFPSPKHRNQHMVDLGADLCLAFAQSWASGTGQCARMARRAGIPVLDYGVDTRLEARPKEEA